MASLLPYLLVAGAVLYGLWRIDARIHPYRRCPRCKGSGRFTNPLMPRYFRLCPRCNGSARLVRRGAGPRA